MLDIPYEKNHEKACALACYTMTARYFFPESTFEKIAKISDWYPEYVIWAFKFWLWIMDKGIKITNYDLIDLEAWANKGVDGLKKSISKREFDFYMDNTKNIKSHSDDIKKVLAHSNFIHYRKKPKWNDLVGAFNRGAVCEITLNSHVLNNKKDFSLHRIVILDINDKEIVFHDPSKKPRPARKESVALFKKAWLETVDEPELCIYEK